MVLEISNVRSPMTLLGTKMLLLIIKTLPHNTAETRMHVRGRVFSWFRKKQKDHLVKDQVWSDSDTSEFLWQSASCGVQLGRPSFCPLVQPECLFYFFDFIICTLPSTFDPFHPYYKSNHYFLRLISSWNPFFFFFFNK